MNNVLSEFLEERKSELFYQTLNIDKVTLHFLFFFELSGIFLKSKGRVKKKVGEIFCEGVLPFPLYYCFNC